MSILSITAALLTVFALMVGFDLGLVPAAGGGIFIFLLFLIFPFLSRSSRTTVQEGSFISVNTESTGINVGSEDSPFGNVRSK